jgi:putative holliday junction resolvase
VIPKVRTKLLGVDYGTVRVGLAISDSGRMIASPLEIRERRDDVADAKYFKQICEREEIGLIVLGMPYHTDGRIGKKALESRAYGEWLKGVTGLPLVYGDERFSTVFAESALWNAGLTHKKRQQRRDAVAAQFMLQAFIEAGCPETLPEEPALTNRPEPQLDENHDQ